MFQSLNTYIMISRYLDMEINLKAKAFIKFPVKWAKSNLRIDILQLSTK